MRKKGLAASTVPRRYTFFRQIHDARGFLLFVSACFFVAGAATPYPEIARWVGFAFAAYATVANDSLQTIGTFLASNRQRPWWALWVFIAGVFLFTVWWSWTQYGGDVSYERLSAKGFTATPTTFTFLQVAAPIFLLVLTRLRMPVSTTFLILSCFSTSAGAIGPMLVKSVGGYGVAFVTSIVLWLALTRALDRVFVGEARAWWGPLQWASTAFLWATWVMQDAANIAVYLPRSLSATAFVVFAGTIVVGLGILFYLRGDRIQRVVNEKTDVLDVRHATIIDLVYAVILYVFKEISVIPMSTTWVFIGLLAGRELAIRFRRHGREGWDGKTWRLIGRDLGYAGIGLAVSLALALAANPSLR